MGRFRTLSRCPKEINYNDYYKKKDSTTILKFARSIVYTNKDTDNFKLCCTTNKIDNTYKCYIACFESYASLIKLLKRQAHLDKDCNTCADIPLSLMNGLESEVCFTEFYDEVNKFSDDGCRCLNVRKINNCVEKLGRLYPYGHFNNNCKSPNISLKRKLYLKCDDKEKCPTYVFCKCKPDAESCKCCDYNVYFPFKDKFLSYTVSGCDQPGLYDYFNNPTHNPSKTYEIYKEGLLNNERLEKEVADIFSKYNIAL